MASEPAGGGKAGDAAPQKHFSGMLIASIFLSLAGFVLLPLIGPVAGLILAFYGRKKVLADPLLIGPRFAKACLVVALLALPIQGYFLYQQYPVLVFQDAMGKKVSGFFESMKGREYDRIFGMMAPAWQQAHTADDVKGAIENAFPGTEPIVVPDDGVTVREEAVNNEDVDQRFKAFWGDYPSKISLDLPYVVALEGGKRVEIAMKVEIERKGYSDFSAEILDFTATPLPGEEATPPEGTGPEEGSAPDAGAEESGAAEEDAAAKEEESAPDDEEK